MTTLLLAAYAALLLAVAGPRLGRARWVVRAPGLGLFAWQMWCAAVVTGATLAGATAVLHWDNTHDLVCRAWQVCLDALLGAHGVAAQAVAAAGAALLGAAAVRLGLAGWRLARAEGRQRRRLRGMLSRTGRRLPGLGVIVVPADEPAAYLLPGGGVRDVVVTSAAVDHLTGEQLQAVAAHEQAHATGGHYRLVRTARLLDRAFPWVSCFGTAVRQVHRLVELRADDVAVRRTPPIVLAHALVALAEARVQQAGAHAAGRPGTGDTGPLLAADGGDATERLHRLLYRPRPLPRALTGVAVGLFALLPLLPVLIAALERSPLAP
ncbi:M56 family metallopeptidase [Dactylosporangium sp. NPDC049140]|uniref:M56 family metallopeptidase n=1 Tax=Dactylosporangium sp. NPDC049140 TaxID=3155647 RepID=UPI0033E5A6AD